MDDRRQKNQLVLAFMEEYRGEAPKGLQEGTESSAGKRGIESPAIAEQLMEEVCGRENCKQALKRVKANKGSAGVDGMTVQQLPEFLKQHWPAIREQLLSGTYKPQPVRRVEIPKPDGGVRKLGVPTVLDRFIQQAVMQVLQRRWDPTFSDHSYGFRPGRSASSHGRSTASLLCSPARTTRTSTSCFPTTFTSGMSARCFLNRLSRGS